MGQTISEKIFSKSVGRTVKAGDFVEAAIDVAMIHDITGPLAVKTLYEITDRVWDPTKVIMLFDHQVPADSIDAAVNHLELRKFAKRQGVDTDVSRWLVNTLKYFTGDLQREERQALDATAAMFPQNVKAAWVKAVTEGTNDSMGPLPATLQTLTEVCVAFYGKEDSMFKAQLQWVKLRMTSDMTLGEYTRTYQRFAAELADLGAPFTEHYLTFTYRYRLPAGLRQLLKPLKNGAEWPNLAEMFGDLSREVRNLGYQVESSEQGKNIHELKVNPEKDADGFTRVHDRSRGRSRKRRFQKDVRSMSRGMSDMSLSEGEVSPAANRDHSKERGRGRDRSRGRSSEPGKKVSFRQCGICAGPTHRTDFCFFKQGGPNFKPDMYKAWVAQGKPQHPEKVKMEKKK